MTVKHPEEIREGAVSERLIGQFATPNGLLDYLYVSNVQFDKSTDRSFVSVMRGDDANWDDSVNQ